MFKSFRKFSAFAAEDIPVMSKVFTTWGNILKVGSAMLIATQAFTALQLKIERMGIERKVEGIERKVEGIERKMEGLEKTVEGMTSEMRSVGLKLDQALEKKG